MSHSESPRSEPRRADDLVAVVRLGQQELVENILARVRTVGQAAEKAEDAAYLRALRSAVEAAVGNTICVSFEDVVETQSVPEPILDQVRLAVHRGTPLEVVLRRYQAGHAVMADFVAEIAEREAFDSGLLRRVLRSQAAETERILRVISVTYRHEVVSAASADVDPRSHRVRRLLDGEMIDPSSLGYDLDRWHVGLIARKQDFDEVVRLVGRYPDTDSLIVPGHDGRTWAWIAFADMPGPCPKLATDISRNMTMTGIGEPAHGPVGWRLTYEQAGAAYFVALRGPGEPLRYADVALVASALSDETLVASLRTLYVKPLTQMRDGGKVLRRTLFTYLESDRNVSSTAHALGVSRTTVSNRLRSIESKIGPLRPSVSGDIALALKLDSLIGADKQPVTSKTMQDDTRAQMSDDREYVEVD